MSTRIAAEFLTAQPIRYLRRKAEFGKLTLQCLSSAGMSHNLPPAPTISKVVFSAFLWGKRTPFCQPRCSADLRSATEALAKKAPSCTGKTTPFPGRGYFGTISAGKKKHLWGRATLFPPPIAQAKKKPSETRALFG